MLLALALGAGLTPAAAQRPTDVPPPPGHREAEPETTMLGANYRIAITTTVNGKKQSELAVLTCSSPFQISGFAIEPTADDVKGEPLTLRGALAEQADGSLKLSYDMRVDTPVPMQTIGLAGTAESLTSTFQYKKTGAMGMLLLKPGQSYEVMKISGMVCAITLTPTETPPAPKVPPTPPAEASRPENRRPATAERRGPTEEDRRRYESLSDDAKSKFRDAMRELFSDQKFRNLPEEERRAQIQKAYIKAETEDRAQKK